MNDRDRHRRERSRWDRDWDDDRDDDDDDDDTRPRQRRRRGDGMSDARGQDDWRDRDWRDDGPRVSEDTRARLMYDANKKSVLIAYVLWFFLGFLGGHRFYMGKTGTAIAQLLMFLSAIVTSVILIGGLIFIALIIWVLIDAFRIPGWVTAYNSYLAYRIGEI